MSQCSTVEVLPYYKVWRCAQWWCNDTLWSKTEMRWDRDLPKYSRHRDETKQRPLISGSILRLRRSRPRHFLSVYCGVLSSLCVCVCDGHRRWSWKSNFFAVDIKLLSSTLWPCAADWPCTGVHQCCLGAHDDTHWIVCHQGTHLQGDSAVTFLLYMLSSFTLALYMSLAWHWCSYTLNVHTLNIMA